MAPLHSVVYCAPVLGPCGRPAIAVPEAVAAARGAALPNFLSQRSARPMQADTNIVGSEGEVGSDPLPRLLLKIGASNNLGIVWPECRNEVLDAAAWVLRLVRARLIRRLGSLSFVRSLDPMPRGAAPIVVD